MKDYPSGSIVFNHLVTGIRPGKRGLGREFCRFLAEKGIEKVEEFKQKDFEANKKNSYEIISFNLKHTESGLNVELCIDVNLFNDAEEYRNINIYDFYEYDIIREFLRRNNRFKEIDFEYIEVSEHKV